MGRGAAGEQLDGWKAIAGHLRRDESTAKRWEAARGLPVRRVPGGNKASVYAYASELDAWRASAAGLGNDATLSEPAAPAAIVAAPPSRRRFRRAWLLAAAVAVPVAVATAVAGSRPHPAADHLADAVAADSYFAGVHALGSRTPAGIAAAERDFEATIQREPGFAPAHVGLAECFDLAREFGAMPDAEAYPKAEREARLALALDPNLAGAHRALAFGTFWFRRDAPAAEAEFRRALELAPDEARTHHWFANMLSMLGRIPEAQAEIDRARALAPESTAIQADRALILAQSGDVAGARAELARLAALDPRTSGPPEWGARLALQAGDGPSYIAQTRTAAGLRGDADEARLADAAAAGWARSGQPGLLAALAAETDRQQATVGTRNYVRAQLAALRGDIATAALLLRADLAAGDPQSVGILGDMMFARLRATRHDIVASARSALHIQTRQG